MGKRWVVARLGGRYCPAWDNWTAYVYGLIEVDPDDDWYWCAYRQKNVAANAAVRMYRKDCHASGVTATVFWNCDPSRYTWLLTYNVRLIDVPEQQEYERKRV